MCMSARDEFVGIINLRRYCLISVAAKDTGVRGTGLVVPNHQWVLCSSIEVLRDSDRKRAKDYQLP